ncbi:MAG: hypoxanthine phosphoribosyltransferase [Bacteroidota bacterium]
MTSTIVQVLDLAFRQIISPEDIQARVAELGVELEQRMAGRKPLMLGVLNGSFIFAADLIRACHFDCAVSFVKLSSYAGTQSTGKVTTLIGLDENLKGRDLIVVEDIIDTGQTLHAFLQTLQRFQPASITVVSLLVKPDAIEYDFPIDLVGFNIPNEFVIGYGLDYNDIGRNLPGIYQKLD